MDANTIRAGIQGLFPTAVLDVNESGEIVLVRGALRSADQAEQLKEYLEKTKTPYVNMTTLSGVQQVQLQVRVAEVSRAASRAMGVNWFATGHDFFTGQRVGSASGGPLVPSINIGPFEGQDVTGDLIFVTPEDGIGASPLVTIFAGFPRANLEFFFQALAENQFMRILANPTLITLSGEEATFLAGGEFPIPVVQGGGGGGLSNAAITIEYKEFGVRLTFRPVVLGDNLIRLRAMQEVSALTDIGALVIQGFSVPALTARRAEATMELQSGQSFAMAGLLQQTDAAVNSRIPGLGDLPVLGPLFRSVRYRNDETELLILVTASLVEPMSLATAPPLPGATHVAPNDWELYVEGRIAGKAPARLDPTSAEWLRQMGLDQLIGPGAWDTYEREAPAAMTGGER
jgi:pilus assembly protein CpaC